MQDQSSIYSMIGTTGETQIFIIERYDPVFHRIVRYGCNVMHAWKM